MRHIIFTLLFLVNLNLFAVPVASAWDGTTYAVKNYLKENLNDPKSIEIVECSPIMELSNGLWMQRVKFRGKNAYGSLVLNEFMFLISGDGTNTEVISIGTIDEMSEALTVNNLTIIASYNHDGTKID